MKISYFPAESEPHLVATNWTQFSQASCRLAGRQVCKTTLPRLKLGFFLSTKFHLNNKDLQVEFWKINSVRVGLAFPPGAVPSFHSRHFRSKPKRVLPGDRLAFFLVFPFSGALQLHSITHPAKVSNAGPLLRCSCRRRRRRCRSCCWRLRCAAQHPLPTWPSRSHQNGRHFGPT